MKLNERKLVLLGLTLSIPILLYSAPITIPVTFADGNVLTAAQLNQNFTAILNKINELDATITNLSDKVNGSGNLLYPDGVNGEVVSEVVSNNKGYTVPAGKTFYITASVKDINGFGVGVDCRLLTSEDVNMIGCTGIGETFPIIIKEGLVITGGMRGALLIGFLKSNSMNITITEYISSQKGYTVPIGKTLYLVSKGYAGLRIIKDITLKVEENNKNFPLIIKEGFTIFPSEDKKNTVITGYLK